MSFATRWRVLAFMWGGTFLKFQFTLPSLFAAGLVVASGHAAAREWNRFEVIEWQSRTPAAYGGLRRLGVSAGALIADRERPSANPEARLAALRQADLGYYVENIATDFYAPYHRWRPGVSVTALYDETVARWRTDPADPTVFFRQPSLVDPAWLGRVRARLGATVRAHAPFAPLFFDLGDEGGIADLSSAWDFDRSPASLAAMRLWLARQYGSLASLNTEWGTRYGAWDEVVPDTTSAAMRRGDDNYASWSDFKAWMDASFADAVRTGTDAVHAADPDALAGIEGGQMAGWGGYDYSRLAAAVDVMEIYPDAANVEIAQSMNPRLVTLATAYVGDPGAPGAIWRAALRGSRGVVLWDEGDGLVREDGRPGGQAAVLAPVLAALRGPLGAALLSATPLPAEVAVLYSQASFRVRWMLDHRAAGDAWTTRGSAGENDDSAWRAAMRGVAQGLLQLGVRPLWISAEQLAQSVPAGIKVVLLPHSLALGDDEVRALAAFRARGGRVVADVAPGQFDAHARRRAAAPTGVAELMPELWPTDATQTASMLAILERAGVQHPIAVTATDPPDASGTEIRVARGADGLLVSLFADTARSVRLDVPHDCGAYDLQTGTRLDGKARAAVPLRAGEPAMFSIRPTNR